MIHHDGHDYGQAADIAAALGADITAERVRDWARRSRKGKGKLAGMLPGHHLPGQGRGTTWYRLDHAAQVERATRLERRGRQRTRQVELTQAA
ncbi:hypothetical protein [Verrucosispora sp. WMMD1129]|uniref:hypothetical protein n=1 Tax=Verrucosispora sp. WMMD1129 TaxID=3016093 RepID=UPI00249BDF92|nr:hypothetical protein [Verrucosispora sp. WMMD1129]WFE45318.1 hypothetical protein O7624_13635 [Verrucosispora sp. WMMD1129]